jgi:hypothetical protein
MSVPDRSFRSVDERGIVLADVASGMNHHRMTADRVQAHTSDPINAEIERAAEQRVIQSAQRDPHEISSRLDELEREWDIERWLEMNASALAFTGLMLGLFVHRRFLLLPAVVLPFLFQHATQGWCPPLPILRRRGVRTQREIDQEKYALKALRGDFRHDGEEDATNRARSAWMAARA